MWGVGAKEVGNAQLTGVFEHPAPVSSASFGQVFNNHVQQQQPFNNCVKDLLNSRGAYQASSWNCYGCEPNVPPQRPAKGPSRGHGNCRHSDQHAPEKGVVPEEPVLVQSGCQIGRRVIAAPFADSVDNSFDRMGAAQHLAATGVELPAPMPVGRSVEELPDAGPLHRGAGCGAVGRYYQGRYRYYPGEEGGSHSKTGRQGQKAGICGKRRFLSADSGRVLRRGWCRGSTPRQAFSHAASRRAAAGRFDQGPGQRLLSSRQSPRAAAAADNFPPPPEPSP